MTPESKRFYDTSGNPVLAEHALAQLMEMMGAPTREMAMKLGMSAFVYGALDQAQASRELAASNRDLALSYDALTDEMRQRRGVRADAA